MCHFLISLFCHKNIRMPPYAIVHEGVHVNACTASKQSKCRVDGNCIYIYFFFSFLAVNIYIYFLTSFVKVS